MYDGSAIEIVGFGGFLLFFIAYYWGGYTNGAEDLHVSIV